jgi:hypothetical protein
MDEEDVMRGGNSMQSKGTVKSWAAACVLLSVLA